MVRSPYIILILLCFLLQPIQGFSDKTSEHYRYTVSWDGWNYDDPQILEKINFYLNGKSIGNPKPASKTLEELPLKKGERIKLDAPTDSKGISARIFFYYNSFLYQWVSNGVIMDMYVKGKKMNCHILTWKDWLNKGKKARPEPEYYVKTMDDVTWIVDGEEIGDGTQLLKFAKKWEKLSDVVILKMLPSGFETPSWGLPEDGENFTKFQELCFKKKFPIFVVQPADLIIGTPKE